MEIRHAGGVDGAATAEGAVVVIDVFRAFSVSAYASPTQISQADLAGRVLVQRSSAGTQAMVAAVRADQRFAASLVVAAATARAVAASGTSLVTLVASRPDHLEDVACARLLEAYLRGATPPHDLLAELLASERYRGLAAGALRGSPGTDYALALATDRFDFAMPVGEDEFGTSLTARR